MTLIFTKIFEQEREEGREPWMDPVTSVIRDTCSTPSKVTYANTNAAATLDSDSTAVKAMAIVANEAALELSDLHDATSFVELGVDSLMSLVIAEKFREELEVIVSEWDLRGDEELPLMHLSGEQTLAETTSCQSPIQPRLNSEAQ